MVNEKLVYLRIVAEGLNALRSPERATLAITHYHRLLEYLVPDVIHVLVEGRIVKSGDRQLALDLEERGYAWIEQELALPTTDEAELKETVTKIRELSDRYATESPEIPAGVFEAWRRREKRRNESGATGLSKKDSSEAAG